MSTEPCSHDSEPDLQIRMKPVMKRERSPTPPSPTTRDLNPDEALDIMIRRQSQSSEAMLVRLENKLGSQLSALTETIGNFQPNLMGIDQRLRVLERKPVQSDPRIDRIELQLQALQQQMQQGPSSHAVGLHERHQANSQSPAHEHRVPPAVHDSEVDFNHLILGGWKEDTRKAVIERETGVFTGTWSAEDSAIISRVEVYGKRHQICHLYLSHLPFQQAKSRFFDLRQKYNEKHPCSSGQMIWMSASKTLARRFRDKATRTSLQRLTSLCDGNPDLINNLDTDWSKQIIWLRDVRVAAGVQKDLRADPEHRVIHRRDGLDGEDHITFHYNISLLSKEVGKTAADVEASLQSD